MQRCLPVWISVAAWSHWKDSNWPTEPAMAMQWHGGLPRCFQILKNFV